MSLSYTPGAYGNKLDFSGSLKPLNVHPLISDYMCSVLGYTVNITATGPLEFRVSAGFTDIGRAANVLEACWLIERWRYDTILKELDMDSKIPVVEEPITVEWLVSVGGKDISHEHTACKGFVRFSSDYDYHIEISSLTGTVMISDSNELYSQIICTCKTRQDVLDLLRILGWKREVQGDN